MGMLLRGVNVVLLVAVGILYIGPLRPEPLPEYCGTIIIRLLVLGMVVFVLGPE